MKPHLGPAFETLEDRLRRAIEAPYALPAWKEDDRVLHKRADRLAAASEALHVAGWARAELAATLNIDLAPVMNDPLPRLPGLQPWEPWPARLAASVFPRVLAHLQDDLPLTFASDLVGKAVEREGTIAMIAGAFSRLPAGARRAPCVPPTGSGLSDTLVFAEADDGSQRAEGVVIDGDRLDDGSWDLEADFTLMTTDGEVLVCNGANCHVERQ